MTSEPWKGGSDQLFVLLTGANSGVGLGTAFRLIDEFLTTRSLDSHLVLIVTTRSSKKSRETITTVRSHVTQIAASAACVGSRGGHDYAPESTTSRIHLLSVELDLCKLSSVYAAADRLLNGQVRDPTGAVANGEDVAVPRLDVTIFNAGIGGWEGLAWPLILPQILRVGIMHSFTYPAFKKALPSLALPPQDIVELAPRQLGSDGKQPQLAEVFCANLFGHYLLAHELLPLTTRRSTDSTLAGPARIIWTSTIDAETGHLDFDDFQAQRSTAPYESSKRITDLLCLSSNVPGRGPKLTGSYFDAPGSPSSGSNDLIKPKFYLSHPGIVVSTLFPLNAFLFFWYTLAMYLARWLGSPWHPITAYLGSVASVHLALASEETLEAEKAVLSKFGSAADTHGKRAWPKKTEVEGWGWEGEIEDPQELQRDKDGSGILAKLHGRKWDAKDLTREGREQFDEEARRCWGEMERLRGEWEGIMGRRSGGAGEDKHGEHIQAQLQREYTNGGAH